MCVWQCRLLLGVVLLHLALSSPVVRRDVLALTHEPEPNPLAEVPPETLGEDAFGPNLDKRGGREKRLLKTLGLGALGVKAAKAVGTKVVAAGAKALGATVVKTGAAVKAVATGAIGLKAKAIGVKTVTAVAALGIKALLFKLLFGKINQLITHKERLLHQLDEYNKVQNEKFSQQLFGHAPCKYPGSTHAHSSPAVASSYPTVAPSYSETPYSPEPLPDAGGFSQDPLPQLTKSSLQPRRPSTSSVTAAPGDDDIPQFDPNKVSLQVPDELFAPAFNSVNSISTIIGNLIQNTAERIARLVERLKPVLRSSLGFRSRKRQTENEVPETEADNETTFFGEETKEAPAAAEGSEAQQSADGDGEIQETAGSEKQTSVADEEHSVLKTSYTALVGAS